MNQTCRKCGAELLAATSFCRQCGTAISPSEGDVQSEQPTALLGGDPVPFTQRLDSRQTAERNLTGLPDNTALLADAEINQKKSIGRTALIAGVVTIFLVGILCAVALFSLRSHNRARSTQALIYPGAKTVVDMKFDDGSRALTLETADEMSKVESWYQMSLKPLKTLRLTPNSVVIKNDTTVATIVWENNKTNIMIKMTP
jgi:hypothetical protein